MTISWLSREDLSSPCLSKRLTYHKLLSLLHKVSRDLSQKSRKWPCGRVENNNNKFSGQVTTVGRRSDTIIYNASRQIESGSVVISSDTWRGLWLKFLV